MTNFTATSNWKTSITGALTQQSNTKPAWDQSKDLTPWYLNGTTFVGNANFSTTFMLDGNTWKYMLFAVAPTTPFSIVNYTANATSLSQALFNMSSKCPQFYAVASNNNKTGAIATQVGLLVAGALAMLY
jgi:hypothetical protein